MSTELALYNDPFEGDFLANAINLASKVSRTAFVPETFRNKPDEVLAAILSGREVGIGPMMSLQKINVIKGKPTQSGELMRALVLSRGHEIWTEDYTTTRVTVCGKRAGSDHVNKVTWTLDDAKRAKLEGKDNWRQYPRAMLLARATGELCRLMFADVLGGISYTPEEIEDGLFEAPEELPPGEAPEEPKAITRKAAPAKKAAARKAAAPAQPPAVREPEQPSLPGEEEPTRPSDEAVKRAQQIAMKCQDVGLDDEGRHRLVAAVTNGRVSSAKEVTAEEGADVLRAVHDIGAGRKALVESDEGWALIDVEDATGDESEETASSGDQFEQVGNEAAWTADQWRQFLQSRDVRVVDALREANRLCRESPDDFGAPPASLDDFRDRQSLCSLVRGWAEDQVVDPEASL